MKGESLKVETKKPTKFPLYLSAPCDAKSAEKKFRNIVWLRAQETILSLQKGTDFQFFGEFIPSTMASSK
jgi:hypothetical protein